MARELATTVILTDDKTGAPITFLKGDTPEKKYADQIVNPKAWGDESVDDGPVPEPEAEPDEVYDDPAPDPEPAPEGDDDDLPEPPRGGKGSGKEAWAAYAQSKGIELDDDATAKDYQDAVDAL